MSFYRDGLGLEVDWKDDVLAVLRSPGDTAHALVIREVAEEPGTPWEKPGWRASGGR